MNRPGGQAIVVHCVLRWRLGVLLVFCEYGNRYTLLVDLILIALHSETLPAASLAIGKDSRMITL